MVRILRLWIVTLATTLLARTLHGPLLPSWSFGFELVVRFLRRDWEQTASWTWTRLRADWEARKLPARYVKRVEVLHETWGSLNVSRFRPPSASSERTILYFHGGSYVYGSARVTHAELLAHLALATSYEVVGVDYRLAPEHPYPAQLEDACAAFDALLARGVAAQSVIVMGDSAGGNLAFYLQHALVARGGATARTLVLLSPWSDLTMPGASFTTHDAYDYGTRDVLLEQARCFAGAVPLDDPRVSPVNADARGLGPTLIVVGEREIPHDDIMRLARRLEQAAVPLTLHVAKDMPHNALVFTGLHPSADLAFDAVVAFVRG